MTTGQFISVSKSNLEVSDTDCSFKQLFVFAGHLSATLCFYVLLQEEMYFFKEQ